MKKERTIIEFICDNCNDVIKTNDVVYFEIKSEIGDEFHACDGNCLGEFLTAQAAHSIFTITIQ